MPFCWHPQGVYCVAKTPIPSPRFVLSTTLSPSLRSCSRLLFPRATPVTWKEKSPPSRPIAAKTPHRQIPDPTPAPVQNPALSHDRQHWDLALSLLELWETYRPAAAPGIQGNRGYIYILTGQMEEARRIHDELVSFYTKPEGTFLGPLKFFEHFGTQIKMPRLIFKSTPSYTDAAIKANVQGVILCSVVVEVDGTISNPQVIKGLGHGLDESALREFQQWRFAPGTLNGEPIRVRATIEVTIKSRRIIR